MEEQLSNKMSNITLPRNSNRPDWLESGDSSKNMKTTEIATNLPKEFASHVNNNETQVPQYHSDAASLPPVPQYAGCARHHCQHRRQPPSMSSFPPQEPIHQTMNQNFPKIPDHVAMGCSNKVDSKLNDPQMRDMHNNVKFNPNVTVHQCPRFYENSSCPSENFVGQHEAYDNVHPFICNKHLDNANSRPYAFRRDVTNNFMQPTKPNVQNLCQRHSLQGRIQMRESMMTTNNSNEQKDQNNNLNTENNNRDIQAQNEMGYDKILTNQEKTKVNSPKCHNRLLNSANSSNAQTIKSNESKVSRRKYELKCRSEEDTGRYQDEKGLNEHGLVQNEELEESDAVDMGYPPIKSTDVIRRQRNAPQRCSSVEGTSVMKTLDKSAFGTGVKRRNGLE